MGTKVSGFTTPPAKTAPVKGGNKASNPTRTVTVTPPGTGGAGKR